MSTYIVTYDLNLEIRRPPITKAIKELGSWAKLSESSYAVSCALSSGSIYNRLKPLFDGNDQIYIITLSKPWYGFGPKEVNEWLDKHLAVVGVY